MCMFGYVYIVCVYTCVCKYVCVCIYVCLCIYAHVLDNISYDLKNKDPNTY